MGLAYLLYCLPVVFSSFWATVAFLSGGLNVNFQRKTFRITT